MEIGLNNEQMRLFVEIIQMVALLDEAVQKYIAEFYSLCDDEKTINAMMRNIKDLESACVEIQRILKKNKATNKPKIEKMTEKYHQIKEIRNHIAHDRRLLIVTNLRDKFTNYFVDELFDDESRNIKDESIENLYSVASDIFNDFRDFLDLLYYEPDEEEYRVERRMNLYGK